MKRMHANTIERPGLMTSITKLVAVVLFHAVSTYEGTANEAPLYKERDGKLSNDEPSSGDPASHADVLHRNGTRAALAKYTPVVDTALAARQE